MLAQRLAVFHMPFSNQMKFQRYTALPGPSHRSFALIRSSNSLLSSFPGQEHVAGSYKIPTVMFYDKNGTMKVAGAEADGNAIIDLAEDEDWTKAELCVFFSSSHSLTTHQYCPYRFKLRLRPQTMKLKMNGMRLPPLPKGKTAVQVFGDYLRYLFKCTKDFIINTHAGGASLWRALEEDLQFVLSHPNGWEGAQQTKMRRAAVYGGLIPDTDAGKARIRFVTEGEASLHACVLNGLATEMLTVHPFNHTRRSTLMTVFQGQSGHGFLVADAGGGTLDISSYAVRGTNPLVMEEIAPPDCLLLFRSRLVLHSILLFQASLPVPFLLVEEPVPSLKVG
jgi:hypothetical protein